MPIGLRSATITQSTPAMREAMAREEVGDDVLGDDPTVARLVARTAEILVDANAHIYYYESGAPAELAGGN